MKGEVVYYRLFDVGASVDLDEMRRTIDIPFLAGKLLSERSARGTPASRSRSSCTWTSGRSRRTWVG